MSYSNQLKQKNDGIFQLSLTEIAFMLIFILLLLFGWLYSDAMKKLSQFKQENDRLLEVENEVKQYGESYASFLQAVKLSENQGRSGEALLKSLQDLIKSQAELEQLKAKLENQDETITKMMELFLVDQMNEAEKAKFRDDMTALMAFQEQLLAKMSDEKKRSPEALQQLLSQSIELVQAVEAMLDLPENVTEEEKQKALAELLVKIDENKVKENADLRGQVAYLQRRLNTNGGRDLPPCWADEETGKIEYLLRVDILPEGLKATPVWSDKRAEDAKAIPNIEQLVNRVHNRERFRALVLPIRHLTDAKQCRHYVYIKNYVNNLNQFNNSRYIIEGAFYKLELR